MGKTNDFGFVLDYHSELIDAKRYKLFASDGPKNVPLLDTVRQNCYKFLKARLEDGKFPG